MKPQLSATEPWPITLSDLTARRDAWHQRMGKGWKGNWKEVTATIALLGIFIAPLFLLLWLDISKRISDKSMALWTLLYFATAGLVGWRSYRALKNTILGLNLVCPTCKKPLVAKDALLLDVAFTTGNCGNCGHVLVSDHPARRLGSGTSPQDPHKV